MREKNDCLIIGHMSIESYRDLETVILLPPSAYCPATALLLLAFPLLAGGGAAGLPTADLMTCWPGSRLQLAAT